MAVVSDKSTQSPTPSATGAPEWLAPALPFLRRYARAVTGSQSSGDAMVRATLEAALANPELLAQISSGRPGLYQAFTTVWASVDAEAGRAPNALDPASASQLGRVPSLRRQALLLNQLEDFSIADTGTILGVDAGEAQALVDAALSDIAHDAVADVLIIEDEPLISSHLQDIVQDAGHRLVASAITADQAREAYELYRPTLVLSDVQLADGSSGIDAVKDILKLGPVPVIFITGYPEKLLTGEKPEPAFLISKPFREETVRTTISQALFFGVNLES